MRLPAFIAEFLLAAAMCCVKVRANCEQKGGCKAYPCFEKTAMCGDNGYLMAYGLKYCERFSESYIYNLFDSAGKDFINCTTPCLVHQMQKYIDSKAPQIDCDDLTDKGFDSHSTCYLQCDFCNVCKTNKAALFKAYDATDFFTLRAIKQIWAIIAECGVFGCLW